MSLTPATNKQVPDNAILDILGKQTYLGNQYSYSIPSTSIGTTSETPFLLLRNPAVTTAAFPAAHISLFVNIRKIFTLTDAENCIMRFYFGATVTGTGTPVTPLNLRPASSNVAIGLLGTSPTVSGNGSCVDFIASSSMILGESRDLLVIDPGQTVFVTVQASANPTLISGQLSWYEL